MKLNGQSFENSPACHGVSYTVEDAPIDTAVIGIAGRYPESGSWAINHESHEMVYVSRGMGSLAVRGTEPVELQTGDVAHVAPGQYFAWDGDMQIVMSCNPPFSPDQYEVKKEGEL